MFDGRALQQNAIVSFAALFFLSVALYIMLSSFCFPHLQAAARQARHDIITSTPGISGAGAAMGNVAEVFEAIARPCPQQGSDLWPSNVHHQRQRVMRTHP